MKLYNDINNLIFNKSKYMYIQTDKQYQIIIMLRLQHIINQKTIL